MSLRRAIRDRMLSRPAVLIAHAVGLVVLSRLLTPTDFGLFALASVIYQIAISMADLGIKSLMLKSSVLDARRHGEALGLALTSAALVGVCFLTIVLSLPDDLVPPSLDVALLILALSVIFAPLELLFNIPLMQGMRFGLISVVNVAGAWTRCGVSILAALFGAGPASLAAGLLAEQLVSFGLFACAKRDQSIPRPRVTGWRTLIADGGRLTIAQVVRYLGELGMLAAISGFLGAATLGVYNRANQVIKLFDSVFLTSIEPVVLPAYVQAIAQGHPSASIYIKKVELLSALSWPAFATIAILADPLCRVILGPGWDQAILIVQLLALIGIALPFTRLSQTLFIAVDALRYGTRLDILHHIMRASFATAGAFISLEAACAGLIIAQIISGVLQDRAFERLTGYRHPDMLHVLMRSAILTAGAAVPAAAIRNTLSIEHALTALLTAAMAGATGFAITAMMLDHTLYKEAQNALKKVPWSGIRRR